MRNRRFPLTLMLLSLLMSMACEVDGDSDAGDATPGPSPSNPDNPNYPENPNHYRDGGNVPRAYYYVRVEDFSVNDSDTNSPGADIDAIALIKSDGTEFYAQNVGGFEPGQLINPNGNNNQPGPETGFPDGNGGESGDNQPGEDNGRRDENNPDGAFNPQAILGPPDAFPDYPNTGTCSNSPANFVSLGGAGGSVIVETEVPIEPGDQIVVVEVGGCQFERGSASAEPIAVSIGVSNSWDANWQPIASGSGPILSATLSDANLPPVTAP